MMGLTVGNQDMAMRTFGQLAIHDPVMAFAGGSEMTRVDIYGAIGWDVYADEFLAAFRAIPAENEIDLRIHSYGGSVTEGWAMALAVQNHKGRVNGTIEGTAASMASIIAMSCDELLMPKNSYIMIHRVSNIAGGNADDLDNAARLTRQFEDDIVNFYSEKTGIATGEIREMMAVDTWMKGPEALEKGFCHSLLEPVKAAAFVGEKNVVSLMGSLPEELRVANDIVEDEEEESHAEQQSSGEDEDADSDGADSEGAEAPEVETGEADEAPEVVEPVADARGVLDWIGNFLGGDRGGEAPNMVAALTVENSRLIAEGETLRADLVGAVEERDRLRAEMSDLNAAATTVHAAIAECGFDPADVSALPGPVNDAPDGSGGLSVLERFEAMSQGKERSEFYALHSGEILKLYSDRAKVSDI